MIEFLEDKRNVTKSLCNLSWQKSNSKNLVNEGGLEVLMKMAILDDNEIRTDCAVAFHNLTRYPDIQNHLLESYVVETIVQSSSKNSPANWIWSLARAIIDSHSFFFQNPLQNHQ